MGFWRAATTVYGTAIALCLSLFVGTWLYAMIKGSTLDLEVLTRFLLGLLPVFFLVGMANSAPLISLGECLLLTSINAAVCTLIWFVVTDNNPADTILVRLAFSAGLALVLSGVSIACWLGLRRR
jgi:hypothetical protein